MRAMPPPEVIAAGAVFTLALAYFFLRPDPEL